MCVCVYVCIGESYRAQVKQPFIGGSKAQEVKGRECSKSTKKGGGTTRRTLLDIHTGRQAHRQTGTQAQITTSAATGLSVWPRCSRLAGLSAALNCFPSSEQSGENILLEELSLVRHTLPETNKCAATLENSLARVAREKKFESDLARLAFSRLLR